ncbi:MraY family glycosyltransferase [Coxiella burnetii]|uniref:MraY family glycosyltransferase n=1 Tax=Coxiella burnetii TaxID=777 RepID=UPI0000ED0160|nr:MraY family glycosyltransferase [Coxiella burnetii]ACJ20484.1 undecaprenyl-phosphate alpha-N-acetylglucosaminephosphotransferase [Coxiella burnetii CbuK_Q154]AIT63557.1 Undecaprenyl-phosphate alpha-N-acetylglucosaminephosphotransferase [Coxiella burnetii str. Namibia]ATN86118.1 UDP-phosphate alpha-N-acetylglucosaminyltransferase [Coxiella burnetii str. Schperling]EAX32955.1 undecaprenyl-phosphate alpha-N-acetylglucosaminyl 1-phosphate transferase [Coxiella burnetii 'MSU Goat Q177']EDR35266.
MELIKSGLIAFVASLFCIWLLRPLAIRIGFVDRPNDRKWHEREVPLIGGIAMFFSFCFALLTLSTSLLPYRGMLAGSSILVLMGVVDDFSDLSSKLRLFGQLFAALLMIIWGNVVLSNLGNLFFLGDLKIGLWAIPITVIVVLANINAMNMIDGQDGLAGGVALGQALLLLLVSVKLHQVSDFRLLFILIILLIAFLGFNMRLPWRKEASIFMGDSGSTFIAFLLAWFAIDLSQQNSALIKPMTILWIMAFPLFDLINVIVLRVRQKKSIIVASRDHFHHVLHVAGLNTSLSTLLLCALSLLLGIFGLALNYFTVSDGWQFILWVGALFCYIYIVELTRKPIIDNEIDIIANPEG